MPRDTRVARKLGVTAVVVTHGHGGGVSLLTDTALASVAALNMDDAGDTAQATAGLMILHPTPPRGLFMR